MPIDQPSQNISIVLPSQVKYEDLTDGPLREPLGTDVYKHD